MMGPDAPSVRNLNDIRLVPGRDAAHIIARLNINMPADRQLEKLLEKEAFRTNPREH